MKYIIIIPYILKIAIPYCSSEKILLGECAKLLQVVQLELVLHFNSMNLVLD